MTGHSAAIELVVSDLAGTTVSDDGVVLAVFGQVFDRLGARVDRLGRAADRESALEFARATMGQSKIAVFRELLRDDALAATANEWFEELYLEWIETEPPAEIPGAAATLRALRADGVRVCLVTGFAPAVRDALLARLGWDDVYDLTLAPGGELRGRPYPDLVLAAALRLRAGDMRRVAVVGDTTSDLWSGTRAGAGHVVGVLTGAHDRPTLAAAPHTHLLPSIAELGDLARG